MATALRMNKNYEYVKKARFVEPFFVPSILLTVLLEEQRPLIRIDGLHADIVKVDIMGVVHPESLGRQDAPHGGFGILLKLLIGGGSCFGLSSLLGDKDIT